MPGEISIINSDIQQINGSSTSIGLLTDQHIPTLANLNVSNTWASQLLTIPNNSPAVELRFDFTGMAPGGVQLDFIELVVFNCLQWGIGASEITLYLGTREEPRIYTFESLRSDVDYMSSCDRLVHVCVPALQITQPLVSLVFGNASNWVHIAEVVFHDPGPSSECPITTFNVGEVLY